MRRMTPIKTGSGMGVSCLFFTRFIWFTACFYVSVVCCDPQQVVSLTADWGGG